LKFHQRTEQILGSPPQTQLSATESKKIDWKKII